MNESIIQKLILWVETSADILNEKTPIFIEEIARYGVISNAVWAFAASIVFVSISFFIYLLTKRYLGFVPKNAFDDSDGILMCLIISLIVDLFFFSLVLSSVNNVIKSACCPSLYAIQLLKG